MSESAEDLRLRFNLRLRGFVDDEISRGSDPIDIAFLLLDIVSDLARYEASRQGRPKQAERPR
jgi:hypothetical protein